MIASPRGIVVHWTGGTYQANAVDRLHYHWIVEGDGRIVRGKYRMRDNMRKLAPGDQYAAHTGGWNSFRVGLSAAGMKDYGGRSSVGPYPLKEGQVERLLRIASRICFVFDLDPLDPKCLCTHREVWTLHGVKGVQNHQKLDIEYLPFRPDLKPHQVGPYLREWCAMMVRETREDDRHDPPHLALVDPGVGYPAAPAGPEKRHTPADP